MLATVKQKPKFNLTLTLMLNLGALLPILGELGALFLILGVLFLILEACMFLMFTSINKNYEF